MTRRYVVRPDPSTGELRTVEVTSALAHPSRLEIISDEPYAGQRATDGTDISSKAKYQAYLKATGATHGSDFSPEFLRKQREGPPKEQRLREIREDINRAWQTLESKGRRNG